jgi:DNA-binding response OmpR family regulator
MVNKKSVIENSEKVLIGIIDDNPQVATSIAQLLDYNGFDTYQAYNGSDAVHLAEERKPALLVCDIRMEGISGYDVAKMLPNQKILFMTGYDIEETKMDGLKNVVGLMRKPIDINALVTKIKDILVIKK